MGAHLRRHARETLRSGEVIYRDRVELDVALLLHWLVRVAPLRARLALHAVGQPALQVALGRRAEAREGRLRRSRRSRRRHEAVQLAHRWKAESVVSRNIVVSCDIHGVPRLPARRWIGSRWTRRALLTHGRSRSLARKQPRGRSIDFRKVRDRSAGALASLFTRRCVFRDRAVGSFSRELRARDPPPSSSSSPRHGKSTRAEN